MKVNSKLLANIILVFGILLFFVLKAYWFQLEDYISGDDLEVDTNSTGTNLEVENPKNFDFAILPHFMINKAKLEEFYNFLSERVGGRDALSIIVVSPNHFEKGKHSVLSINSKAHSLCYKDHCIKVGSLVDDEFVFDGVGDEPIFGSQDLFENKGSGGYTTEEHGLGEHIYYINKYFSGATLYPLVLAPNNFKDIDDVMIQINQNFTNALILASVDFSHYVEEDFAEIHDKKTYYTLLNSLDIEQYRNIEVDCPTCLYLTNRLASYNGQKPVFRYRDSSALFLNTTGFDNTSRDFYYYDDNVKDDNGLTIAYYGDVIYDRGVSGYIDSMPRLRNHLKEFYQQGDIKHNPDIFHHRKLYGIDFVGFNLETPVVRDKDICKFGDKEINFCSDDDFLPILAKLGFNLIDYANNHSMDGGELAYAETMENLDRYEFKHFGFNNIYTGNIRGIKFVWHGFNFTDSKIVITQYCNRIEQYKEKGYLNFISVHWGNEYQNYHDAFQEKLAEKLIDCGADLIIGHHPHVVQDIERYKGKPIVYSLGNFIFDNKENSIGGYVLIDYQIDGKINLYTGFVDGYCCGRE